MHRLKWHRDLSVKFVKKYMELDVLWNPKNPLRLDPKARMKALLVLQKLVDDPNFTIDEVRRKIKSFRTTYSMELKKIRKSKNQAYVPTVAWFKIMDERLREPTMENVVKTWKSLQDSRAMFLDHDYKKRTSTSSADDNETTAIKRSYSDEENEQEHVEEMFVDDFHHPADNEDNEASELSLPPPPKRSLFQVSTKSSSKNFKKSKQKSEKSKSTAVVSNNTHVQQTSSSICDTEDEFDIFGKSVAIQLRKLPLAQALKAQLDIQTLLINARLNIQESSVNNDDSTEQIYQIETLEESDDI